MSIERREFLKRGLAVGLGAGLSPLANDAMLGRAFGAPSRPPNLVYIMVDEMPQRSWSMGGTAQLHTPNLERLAREGIRFDQCVSNNPICVPHRAIQITGLHSHQNGMRWNSAICSNTGNRGLHPSNPSWARQLKAAGYRTGYVGKWHLYNDEPGTFRDLNGEPMEGKQVPQGPARFGFDNLWAERWYIDKKARVKGYFDESGQLVSFGDYAPAGMFKTTMDFIEKHQSEPFAVFCSPNKPHPPYGRPKPPQKWIDFYRERLGQNGQRVEFRPNVPEADRTDKLRRQMLYCYAQISAIDELVGQLLDRLEELGIADDTIVVFTSDHGDLMYCHGELWKRWPWDESVLVPCIARWPNGIPAGQTTNAVFSSVDIAPTLLGLCGAEIPDVMQGRNIAPFMRGENKDVPAYAPIMYIRPPEGNYMTERMPHLVDYRGVRTERYTYTRRRDPAGQADGTVTAWQLYDNEKDPYQLENLVDRTEYREIQAKLDAMTNEWLAQVGETFGPVAPNPKTTSAS